MTNSYNYNSNDNGQSGLQGSQSMRTVRSTRKMISNVHALVGTILFGIGLCLSCTSFLTIMPLCFPFK